MIKKKHMTKKTTTQNRIQIIKGFPFYYTQLFEQCQQGCEMRESIEKAS